MIEFSISGGETGPLSLSTDFGHRHLPGPVSEYAAKALQVLYWQNMTVSMPASSITLVIHRARVCEDICLCWLQSEINSLFESALHSGAILTK